MVLRQIALGLGQGRLILRHRLGIGRALLGAILHQLLIILLRVLLFQLVLIHLCLQIIHQAVDHAQHTTTLLLLVSANLRGRRRSVNSVLLDLHESSGHPGTSETTRRGCGPDVTAVCRVHLLFLTQNTLRGFLIQLRIVKLLEAILCELQNLNSGLVLRGTGHIVIVLLLTVLGCLSDRLVQVLDALLKGSDLLLRVLDGGVQVTVCLIQPLLLMRELLEPVLGLIEFLRAVCLLGIIVHLLLLQSVFHGINHLDDLIEVHLLALQRQCNQIQTWVLASSPDKLQSLAGQQSLAGLHLQQARAGQRLLEQLEYVVVVQNLYGIRDGEQLVSASLLHCSVVLCLLLAILAELLRIPCVSLQLLLNV
mmetsp:Transcript_113673/g.260924  ORF Transcript_113673/g.260924 Transcript_113673/m.260924 type:complete len:366 (+) Transcript_113673:310-1407(+)